MLSSESPEDAAEQKAGRQTQTGKTESATSRAGVHRRLAAAKRITSVNCELHTLRRTRSQADAVARKAAIDRRGQGATTHANGVGVAIIRADLDGDDGVLRCGYRDFGR